MRGHLHREMVAVAHRQNGHLHLGCVARGHGERGTTVEEHRHPLLCTSVRSHSRHFDGVGKGNGAAAANLIAVADQHHTVDRDVDAEVVDNLHRHSRRKMLETEPFATVSDSSHGHIDHLQVATFAIDIGGGNSNLNGVSVKRCRPVERVGIKSPVGSGSGHTGDVGRHAVKLNSVVHAVDAHRIVLGPIAMVSFNCSLAIAESLGNKQHSVGPLFLASDGHPCHNRGKDYQMIKSSFHDKSMVLL